ncbi:MAG: MerR family transcriptional regulator [Pseudomonadota bacterium]|jgi:DNA-binding transcriptional MerR regulator|nr:MerR family transcriptional regulator [Gammaproteobacteria bacterium]MEC8848136.1 MerR family transcriptional regulator [Pseudomonadota bacterium]|tara:strand:+ start:26168 stop:27049 length:882 start_codon:yes stop_codon:yes gene_type:complete
MKPGTSGRRNGRKTASAEAAEAVAPARVELTIEQLAKASRCTARNIRAYQDRGLIPPPERRGRTGVYGAEHLSRLRIIHQMLTRGFTLASIGELLAAWEAGQDISALLGLEAAVSSPWTNETPKQYSFVELARLYGGQFDPRWLVKAHELGVLKPHGMGFIAPSPRMIQAGAELVKAGIPLDEMLDVVKHLRANVEHAAEEMVHLVERHVFDRFGTPLPPRDQAAELGEIIWRLRPLVDMAVQAEVSRAMEIAATRHLGNRLAHVLDELARQKDPQPPAAERARAKRTPRARS